MSDRLCDICGDYKELCGHDFLHAEIKRLKAENQRLRDGLVKIRDWDYRGNRHQSASIARDALPGGGE